MTCRQESSIDNLRKVVPWLPGSLNTPSADSLLWSTEKKLMRDRFSEYDKSITPRYYYLTDYDPDTIDTNGQNVTLASNLTSSGGSLTKAGNGTLFLTKGLHSAKVQSTSGTVSVTSLTVAQPSAPGAPTIPSPPELG